jgi:hypothetical protein
MIDLDGILPWADFILSSTMDDGCLPNNCRRNIFIQFMSSTKQKIQIPYRPNTRISESSHSAHTFRCEPFGVLFQILATQLWPLRQDFPLCFWCGLLESRIPSLIPCAKTGGVVAVNRSDHLHKTFYLVSEAEPATTSITEAPLESGMGLSTTYYVKAAVQVGISIRWSGFPLYSDTTNYELHVNYYDCPMSYGIIQSA